DDGEPQPRAAGLGRIEVVEGAIELVLGHPLPRVRDCDADAGPVRAPIDPLRGDGPPPRAGPETVEGVADQILQDAPHDERVRARGRERVGEVDPQLRLPGMPETRDGITHHDVYI